MSYLSPELIQGISVVCYAKLDWNFLSGWARETSNDRDSAVSLNEYNKSRGKKKAFHFIKVPSDLCLILITNL